MKVERLMRLYLLFLGLSDLRPRSATRRWLDDWWVKYGLLGEGARGAEE